MCASCTAWSGSPVPFGSTSLATCACCVTLTALMPAQRSFAVPLAVWIRSQVITRAGEGRVVERGREVADARLERVEVLPEAEPALVRQRHLHDARRVEDVDVGLGSSERYAGTRGPAVGPSARRSAPPAAGSARCPWVADAERPSGESCASGSSRIGAMPRFSVLPASAARAAASAASPVPSTLRSSSAIHSERSEVVARSRPAGGSGVVS